MCLKPSETKRIITLTCRTFYCFRDIFTSQKSPLFLLCLLMLEKKFKLFLPHARMSTRTSRKEREIADAVIVYSPSAARSIPPSHSLFSTSTRNRHPPIFGMANPVMYARNFALGMKKVFPLGSDRPGGQPAIQDERERRAFDDSP